MVSHLVRISELRWPIAAKHCTVISMCVNFLAQVQKLGGPPLNFLLPLNLGSILHNFRISARISPERVKVSQIGKTCDRELFFPRSTEEVRWTLVHYPQSSTCEFGPTQIDFFDRLYFDLWGCWPIKFLHALDKACWRTTQIGWGLGLPDCCILNTGDFLTVWISAHVPARVPTFNNKKAALSQVFFGFKVCQRHSLA